MISVIIPTYNRRCFLEGALLSVMDQSRPADEIIIVDDGSEDGTDELVSSLQKQVPGLIRYFRQPQRGAAAARNRGIRQARGDLLCFLDSDDRFAADKLDIQYRAMGENPAYSISHTREIWYRRGRHLNQKKKHAPPHGYIFPKCLAMCAVGMSTVMIRRRLFSDHGFFDESLPCCEDYDFWLRLSVTERFLLVDEPLTIKEGGRPDQLSVIHRVGMDRYRIASIRKLLDSAALSGRQRLQAVSELARKCRIYGNGCIKHGRVDEGRRILSLAQQYAATAANL